MLSIYVQIAYTIYRELDKKTPEKNIARTFSESKYFSGIEILLTRRNCLGKQGYVESNITLFTFYTHL